MSIHRAAPYPPSLSVTRTRGTLYRLRVRARAIGGASAAGEVLGTTVLKAADAVKPTRSDPGRQNSAWRPGVMTELASVIWHAGLCLFAVQVVTANGRYPPNAVIHVERCPICDSAFVSICTIGRCRSIDGVSTPTSGSHFSPRENSDRKRQWCAGHSTKLNG
jgi:hypothetical protein